MANTTSPHQQDSLVSPHVLIVEDDRDIADLFVLIARLQGYSADSAADGEEGLRKLRSRQTSLVVLDLVMPGMSGWDFREQQLRDPAIADVPVLCVSSVPDLEQHGRLLGVHCLAKPVDPAWLAHTLRDLCESERPEDPKCWCSRNLSRTPPALYS